VRAISAPPKRPPQLIRMPSAPNRIADWTARFIARRNATRRSSCWAMFSATKVASISGLRISTMLRCTSPPVMFCRSRLSFSMSAPFLPITTPGRAVWIEMRAFLAGRSMMIRETPAWVSRLRRNSRIRKSSCSSAP
jgi:hypothetical protein